MDALNAEVLFISTDSPYTHQAWHDNELSLMVKGGIPYPMLSDPGGRIGKKYGVYEKGPGVDIRGRFIIDPEGNVAALEVLPPPVGRSVDELLRQLKALQHTTETGEATPSDWNPGKTTLTPGSDLVGKVCEVWKPE